MNNIIRLLSTTDLHGNIYPYSYADRKPRNYGLARLRTMIKQLRDENTVLLDNGDTLGGSALTFHHYMELSHQENPMSICMREMKYDYINIGNHGFNYGYDVMKQFLDDTQATCLTANVLYQGKPIGKEYDIREIAGKKVAFFGVTTHLVPIWEKTENIEGVTFPDAFETAERIVKKIRENEHPDYIVCLYHGGFEKDPVTGIEGEKPTGENQGYRMVKEIDGINVMICGHQHRVYCGTLDGVAYTEGDYCGTYLSCIEINTETNEITPKLLPVEREADPVIMTLAENEEQRTQKWLDSPLGTTDMDLVVHDEFDCRYHKSQLATLINMIQLEKTGADISGTPIFFRAPGIDREITMRDVISTYMFPNTLVVKKIDGRVLKEYLEKSAEFWSVKDGKVIINPLMDFPNIQYHNYDMLDGVEYTIDVNQPVGSRIISLTRNGVPVKDEDTFTLAVNNYRASGGGDFDMIANAETVTEIPDSNVDTIARYIMEHKNISFEPSDNIRIIPENND